MRCSGASTIDCTSDRSVVDTTFSRFCFDCFLSTRAIELRHDHAHSHAPVSFCAAKSHAVLPAVKPGLYLFPDANGGLSGRTVVRFD